MNHFKIFCAALLLVFSATFFSCSDNGNTEEIKSINLFLTDCPFEAQEVNVEILSISLEDNQGFQIDLNTVVGIYNLLDFQDGVDTLIATGNVDFETIKAMYFTLGDNNTIVVDSITYPLELSTEDHIVKVNMNLSQINNHSDFLVDFFACTSVIRKGNGSYTLKPVIKFKGDKNNGPRNHDVEDLLEDAEECYDIVYPISFLDENDAQLTANDQDEMIEIILNNELTAFVYPVTLVNQDAMTFTINNEQEWNDLEKCEDDDEENEYLENFLEDLDDCFEINYPISFVTDAGTSLIANDDDDLNSLKDSLSIVSVEYPFEVLDDAGAVLTITDDVALQTALDDCNNMNNNPTLVGELLVQLTTCFEIVYDITIIDTSSNEIVVNDINQLFQLNMDGLISDVIYPFDVLNNGNPIPVNNFNQLEARASNCDNETIAKGLLDDLRECYTIVYPISLMDSAGVSHVVNDDAELEDLFDTNIIHSIEYPFDVLDASSTTINVSDENILMDLIDNC